MTMKPTLSLFLAATLFCLGTLFAGAQERTLAPDITTRAFISIYHGSYEVIGGVRYKDNVFGLGSGLGVEHWGAYPAEVKKLPIFLFYRRYVPFGKNDRFFMYGDLSLGGECTYKIKTNQWYFENGMITPLPPYWKFRVLGGFGAGVRIWRNCNFQLGLNGEQVGLASFPQFGVNLGFSFSW